MSFDAYRISVKLSLINNMTAGLAAISSQFGGLNKQIGTTSAGITDMERKLQGIKRLGLIGGAMARNGISFRG